MKTTYHQAQQWLAQQSNELQILGEELLHHEQSTFSFQDVSQFNSFLERKMIHAILQLRQSNIENEKNHTAYALAQYVTMLEGEHHFSLPENIEQIIIHDSLVGLMMGQQVYIPHKLVWYRIDMYGKTHLCDHDYTLQLIHYLIREYEKTTS